MRVGRRRKEFRPFARPSSGSRTQGVQILHLPQLQDFRSERRRCSNRDRDLQLLDRARERRDNRTGWRRYERSQTGKRKVADFQSAQLLKKAQGPADGRRLTGGRKGTPRGSQAQHILPASDRKGVAWGKRL